MEPIVTVGRSGLDLIHLVMIGLVLVLAGGLVWLNNHFARKTERLTSERDRLDADLATATRDLDEQRRVAEEVKLKLAAAEARSLDDEKRFAELAQGAVRQAHSHFLERADETFTRHKEGTRGDLEKLIQPIGKTFSEFEAKVKALGEDRAKMGEQLHATREAMRRTENTTSSLVTALSSPKGGGQWGEANLENALKLGGLTKHVDYNTQVTHGKFRPDAVIRLPSGRTIIVDAKASIDEFLKANRETDQAKREQHLTTHARHVRENMKLLASKEYQKQIADTADFVVMYIPGENMFSSALANDPSLFEDGFKKNVIMASPTTLVALAKTVALGWREEQMARNAKEVAGLAHELYKALCVFGGKAQKLGTNIERSMKSYNELVGSLERNVLPKGRRFTELGAAPADSEIAELAKIESHVRLLDVDKDIDMDVIDIEPEEMKA